MYAESILIMLIEENMIDAVKLEEIKKRLIQVYSPLEIYIFGSYAWGTPDEESDLDLLVVVENIDDEMQRHRALVNGHRVLADLRFSKDILLFTKQEFDVKAAQTTTLINKIKKQGKQIYAKS